MLRMGVVPKVLLWEDDKFVVLENVKRVFVFLGNHPTFEKLTIFNKILF